MCLCPNISQYAQFQLSKISRPSVWRSNQKAPPSEKGSLHQARKVWSQSTKGFFWEGSLKGRSRKRTTLIGWGGGQWRGWKAANDVGNWLATDFKLMHHRHPVTDCLFIHQFLKKNVSSRPNRKSMHRRRQRGRLPYWNQGIKNEWSGRRKHLAGYSRTVTTCDHLLEKNPTKKTKPKQQSWKPDNPKGEKEKITSIALTPTLSVLAFPRTKESARSGMKRGISLDKHLFIAHLAPWLSCLFHQGFLHHPPPAPPLCFSADGCSNRGLRELGGGAAAEVVMLSLYLPKQEKSMPFRCRRSARINGRFQKASVKNQCPLHAIDGCLAAEEREWQRTPVYYEKLLPPTLLFWPL